MPVFENIGAMRSAGLDWIELERAELVTLGTDERVVTGPDDVFPVPDILTEGPRAEASVNAIAATRVITRESESERVIVTGGDVLVESEHGTALLGRNQWMDVPASGLRLTNALPAVSGWRPPAELVRFGGRWPELIGSGIFHFEPGRPCDYHFHDFDEYWYVYRGHGDARCGGAVSQVAPGAVLAAPAGEEHGLYEPSEIVEGVSFGLNWTGGHRPGHLWRTVHGDPSAPRIRH